MFELTITVKHDESSSSYKRKFAIYDDCQVSEDDPHIRECIDSTIKEFGRVPDSCKFRINCEVIGATA